jgi:hypothetical protein
VLQEKITTLICTALPDRVLCSTPDGLLNVLPKVQVGMVKRVIMILCDDASDLPSLTGRLECKDGVLRVYFHLCSVLDALNSQLWYPRWLRLFGIFDIVSRADAEANLRVVSHTPSVVIDWSWQANDTQWNKLRCGERYALLCNLGGTVACALLQGTNDWMILMRILHFHV